MFLFYFILFHYIDITGLVILFVDRSLALFYLYAAFYPLIFLRSEF